MILDSVSIGDLLAKRFININNISPKESKLYSGRDTGQSGDLLANNLYDFDDKVPKKLEERSVVKSDFIKHEDTGNNVQINIANVQLLYDLCLNRSWVSMNCKYNELCIVYCIYIDIWYPQP